jgi:N-acetylglutamate synthase-like GNAT family acetyltransferase
VLYDSSIGDSPVNRQAEQQKTANVIIRPATEADQQAITDLVHLVQINPNDLDWQRFIVAEDAGQVVGIGQVKPHSDGTRELASIGTLPEREGQGIASQVIKALLERESGPLYLMCLRHNEGFYPRFGFRRLAPNEMPPYFRRLHRFSRIFLPISYLFIKGGAHLRVMKRG